MKIGEIIEILIVEKDKYGFGDHRKEALEEACCILARLPRMEEADIYEPVRN